MIQYIKNKLEKLYNVMECMQAQLQSRPICAPPRPPKRFGLFEIVAKRQFVILVCVDGEPPIEFSTYLRQKEIIKYVTNQLMAISKGYPRRIYQIGCDLDAVIDWFEARIAGLKREQSEILRQQSKYIAIIEAEVAMAELSEEN